ncbi:MAG: DUF5711 family protein [Clostridia bacterium]|nr:DUF5711 family protein [Clostridia bacterium]
MARSKVNSSSDKKNKLLSIALCIILFLAVLGVAFFVYLKSQNINIHDVSLKELVQHVFSENKSGTSTEKVVEIPFDAGEHPVFTILNGDIVKCNKDSIRGLDKSGQEKWVVPIFANKPIVKEAGAYLVVADMGGRDIAVLKGKEKRWNKKVENNIINVDVNKNGYVSVVQEEKGSKGAVTVYDPAGNEVFIRGKAENYILSALVSSDRQVLINCIDASGITINTNFEFTDIFGKPFANIQKENMIYPSIWYMGEGFFAVNDTSISYFDKDRNEKWKKEHKEIYTSTTVLDKYAVIAVKDQEKKGLFKSKTKVIVYTADGEEKASQWVDEPVKNMYAYDDLIAVNTGREAVFMSSKGSMKGKYTSKSDITDVRLLNKSEALIVTRSSILVVPVS